MVSFLHVKNTLLKIRRSFGRFVSLLLIMLVGVGFFAGIRQSAPDIADSIGRYAGAQSLADFQIVSTMGLTDADVRALAALPGVQSAVPGYFLDAENGGNTVRLLALESTVNKARLLSGRMPKNETECVADARHYRLGQTLRVTGAGNNLKNSSFTVVGLVESPLFLSQEYGSTTVGDGKLYSFAFIERGAFSMNAYPVIYVTTKQAQPDAVFSQNYESASTTLHANLEALGPMRETARYDEIYGKAAQTLDGQEKKLADAKAEGEKKLADAKAALDSGAQKLQNAKTVLAQNKAALQKQSAAQEASFASAQRQIATGRAQLDAALAQNGLSEGTLNGKIAQLAAALEAMREQQSGLPAGGDAYAQLAAQIAQADAAQTQLLSLQSSLRELSAKQEQLNAGIQTFQAQTAAAREKLGAASAQLAQSEKDWNAGNAAYAKKRAVFDAQMAQAQAKLSSARQKLAEIEKPVWTVLDRNGFVNGYGDLKSAIHTIETLGDILPLFFLLIVALMACNTMARMISEERGELGTLVSLGFSDAGVTAGYLFYVFCAALPGAAAGFFLGCRFLPQIIYACFPYILPPLLLRYSPVSLAFILAAAAGLMAAVTVAFCRRELREAPAALLRPVPPKNGKTILLERVGFVWRRLSFTWKVTMRNIFRYKQRVFMMIAGIAGCTALLLAGFGIRDSITGVAQSQFGGIFRYDALIVLKNEVSASDAKLTAQLEQAGAKSPALLRQTSVTCGSGAKAMDAYLVVPQNETDFERWFNLKSTLTGARAVPGAKGAVISQRLSELFGVKKGNKLRVEDTDGRVFSVPVADVAENHVGNYLYLSPEEYRALFGKAASYNLAAAGIAGDKKAAANRLIGKGVAVNVTLTDDILLAADKQTGSLDSVVLLIIVIASLLDIIVLYNLTSINISERTREIATLKVLGFSDMETNEYIYREAFLLTLLGIAVGLALGVGLHRLVMGLIEREDYAYFKIVRPLSFLWSFLITTAFAFLMQLITYFKLRGIDMIESSKTVE